MWKMFWKNPRMRKINFVILYCFVVSTKIYVYISIFIMFSTIEGHRFDDLSSNKNFVNFWFE